MSKKRVAFRRVAEERAAHFARADSSIDTNSNETLTTTSSMNRPVISSTPSGLRPSRQPLDFPSEVDADAESWPGPFSTAKDILRKREVAKRARDEAIAKQQEGSSVAIMEDIDEFDKLVHDVISSVLIPSNLIKISISIEVDSLHNLSIAAICNSYDLLCETFSAIELSDEVRLNILQEMTKHNIATAVRIEALVYSGSYELSIPDCSQINEDSMIRILEKCIGVDFISDENLQSQYNTSMKVIRFLNCGLGMTNRTAAVCVNICNNLQELRLHGCYKLDEYSLSKVLDCCKSTLRCLELSCNHKLGVNSLKKIATLSNLVSLNLDNSNTITDNDLIEAFIDNNGSDCICSLQQLSLEGLVNITKLSMAPLIEKIGHQLVDLNISRCVLLDDTAVESIRLFCLRIQRLNMAELNLISTTSLVALFLLDPSHKGLTNLEAINLSKISAVNDEVIIQLCLAVKTNLKELRIQGCCNISNRSIAAIILYSHRQFQTLDISFVRHIHETMLLSLISKCLCLKTIELWGCSHNISSLFFQEVANMNKHRIVHIELKGMSPSQRHDKMDSEIN